MSYFDYSSRVVILLLFDRDAVTAVKFSDDQRKQIFETRRYRNKELKHSMHSSRESGELLAMLYHNENFSGYY